MANETLQTLCSTTIKNTYSDLAKISYLLLLLLLNLLLNPLLNLLLNLLLALLLHLVKAGGAWKNQGKPFRREGVLCKILRGKLK